MNTISFEYMGVSVRYDPQAGMSLHDLLAAAREVAATMQQVEASPAPPAALPRPTGAGTRPGRNTVQPEAPKGPPKTTSEAEERFYARYGAQIGGTNWQAVQRYLGHLLPKPASIEEWIAVAEEVRDRERAVA